MTLNLDNKILENKTIEKKEIIDVNTTIEKTLNEAKRIEEEVKEAEKSTAILKASEELELKIKTADRLEKANEVMANNLKRIEEMTAQAALGGKGIAGVNLKAPEMSDKDYAEAFLTGKIKLNLTG